MAGRLLLFLAALTFISSKTHFFDQVKTNSTSQLINGLFKVLQKLLKYFSEININFSISCNVCLVFKRFRIRRKTVTWLVTVIIPQTTCCFYVIVAAFKQIVH